MGSLLVGVEAALENGGHAIKIEAATGSNDHGPWQLDTGQGLQDLRLLQDHLKGLEHRHAFLAQNFGLRLLTSRHALQIFLLGSTIVVPLGYQELGLLEIDLGRDQRVLLLGRSPGLLRLLTLLLGGLLLNKGALQLFGQLFALTSQEKFGRNGAFPQPNLFDVDSGPLTIDLNPAKNSVLKSRPLFDCVQDFGTPCYVLHGAVDHLPNRDIAAKHVANMASDR